VVSTVDPTGIARVATSRKDRAAPLSWIDTRPEITETTTLRDTTGATELRATASGAVARMTNNSAAAETRLTRRDAAASRILES
jgi:hypothetical protein